MSVCSTQQRKAEDSRALCPWGKWPREKLGQSNHLYLTHVVVDTWTNIYPPTLPVTLDQKQKPNDTTHTYVCSSVIPVQKWKYLFYHSTIAMRFHILMHGKDKQESPNLGYLHKFPTPLQRWVWMTTHFLQCLCLLLPIAEARPALDANRQPD